MVVMGATGARIIVQLVSQEIRHCIVAIPVHTAIDSDVRISQRRSRTAANAAAEPKTPQVR